MVALMVLGFPLGRTFHTSGIAGLLWGRWVPTQAVVSQVRECTLQWVLVGRLRGLLCSPSLKSVHRVAKVVFAIVGPEQVGLSWIDWCMFALVLFLL